MFTLQSFDSIYDIMFLCKRTCRPTIFIALAVYVCIDLDDLHLHKDCIHVLNTVYTFIDR